MNPGKNYRRLVQKNELLGKLPWIYTKKRPLHPAGRLLFSLRYTLPKEVYPSGKALVKPAEYSNRIPSGER